MPGQGNQDRLRWPRRETHLKQQWIWGIPQAEYPSCCLYCWRAVDDISDNELEASPTASTSYIFTQVFKLLPSAFCLRGSHNGGMATRILRRSQQRHTPKPDFATARLARRAKHHVLYMSVCLRLNYTNVQQLLSVMTISPSPFPMSLTLTHTLTHTYSLLLEWEHYLINKDSCRAGSIGERDWFGQIQLILTIKLEDYEAKVLHLKWLVEEEDHDPISSDVKMPWLRWGTCTSKPRRRGAPRIVENLYDLVYIKSLDGPAYIMPDPRRDFYLLLLQQVCVWVEGRGQ